jgi:ParB-like chromosome segregation protein Spo0J
MSMSKGFSMSKRNTEKMDVFSQGARADEVDKEIYGESKASALDTGVVRAKPTPINTIWADLSQPRRAVPPSVRGRWAGDPDELPDLLEHWRLMAEGESGKKIDVLKVLKNQATLNAEGAGEIYGRYAKLTALAASIRLEGLTNPITIFRNGDMYKIETGERRWLAHHLLAIHIDEKKFGKVLAREVEFNVFRQASENNARDGFNAIEMARQIALLIMDARRDGDGVKYDPLEDLVLAGECDRRFYAQVSNGNVHRVPPGMGEKISHATGLSEARFSQYRRLLAPTDDEELNDRIWVEAEANGWTENYIREYVQTLTAVKVPPADEGDIAPDNSPSATQTDTPATRPFTPNRDGFGTDFPPTRPSPFGQGKPAHVVGKDGEVGAPHENLVGRRVRLRNGYEGSITWQSGDKLLFLRDGKSVADEIYRSAIQIVMPAVPVREAPPQKTEEKPIPKKDGKLVEESQMFSMLGYLKHVATLAGDTEAANSVTVLQLITLGEIRQMSKERSAEETHSILKQHYEACGNLMQAVMGKLEGCLNDWALVDEAERMEG